MALMPAERVRERAELLRRVGYLLKDVTDAQVEKLLRHVGDVELAGDAVLMLPRPMWLVQLIGPVAELVDPPSAAAGG